MADVDDARKLHPYDEWRVGAPDVPRSPKLNKSPGNSPIASFSIAPTMRDALARETDRLTEITGRKLAKSAVMRVALGLFLRLMDEEREDLFLAATPDGWPQS